MLSTKKTKNKTVRKDVINYAKEFQLDKLVPIIIKHNERRTRMETSKPVTRPLLRGDKVYHGQDEGVAPIGARDEPHDPNSWVVQRC